MSPDVANGVALGAVGLELAEVPLDLVGRQRRNAPLTDGLLDVDLPDVLVATNGHRAEVVAAVVLPAGDGVVDGGRCGRHRGLEFLGQHEPPEFLLRCALGTAKGPALVAHAAQVVAAEKDAEL
jgi:hypothetical protein